MMKMKRHWSRVCVASVAALVAANASGQILTASCLDPAVALVVEEARLPNTLPDNANPAVLQTKSFAQQMIEGAGFQDFGPAFVNDLCGIPKLSVAQNLALHKGEELWHMAIDRAQQRVATLGNLPYSDDRPLYWARLQVRAALRQWLPKFDLSAADRLDLITTFDKASRGMFDIKFPAGKGVKRLIFSGFDPYTLDGGTRGTAPGSVGNNIRHGNPSGATVLATDGTQHVTPDGTTVFIEAYVLPVNYPEFEQGYLRDTVGPFMLPGPRQVMHGHSECEVPTSLSRSVTSAPQQPSAMTHRVLSVGGEPSPPPIRFHSSRSAIPLFRSSSSNSGDLECSTIQPAAWTTEACRSKDDRCKHGRGHPTAAGRFVELRMQMRLALLAHRFPQVPRLQLITRHTTNSIANYIPTPLPLPPIGSTGAANQLARGAAGRRIVLE
jgi:hypothetical protein